MPAGTGNGGHGPPYNVRRSARAQTIGRVISMRNPAKHSRTSTRAIAATISIELDPQVLRDVKAAARRSGLSLNAHINQVLTRDLRRRRLAELIAEYEAEAGVIVDGEPVE